LREEENRAFRGERERARWALYYEKKRKKVSHSSMKEKGGEIGLRRGKRFPIFSNT